MVFLGSIGSNLDPVRHVPSVVEELVDLGGTLLLSPVIVTEPEAIRSCHRFANALFVLDWAHGAERLKAAFNQLEETHGRDRHDPLRSVKDRTLDLDLLAEAATRHALDGSGLPGYLTTLWPTLWPFGVGGERRGNVYPAVGAITLPVRVGALDLGHAATAIHRDARSGQIVVAEDEVERLGNRGQAALP